MPKPYVKYPYGISNFEKVVLQNYVFVDKTNYIRLLEEGESYCIFLRPRRMGKSLLVSILEYYYDVLLQDKFQALFSKYYIGQNPTPGANAYRVMKFDFSGIDTQTEESSYRGFLARIRGVTETFMERYCLFDQDRRKSIPSEPAPGQVMHKFFDAWKIAVDGPPIYLIIDEYDHFTNEILIRDLSEFKRSVSQDGYVRKFYETVKIATRQGFVDRFFITGVSPITLDSLTGGFNIGTHLSGDEDFHDMMGFTEEEVRDLLRLVLEDSDREEQIMLDLLNWYNGYRFNIDAEHRVYNSDMVLYFLDKFKTKQRYPDQMPDPNIMPDYGKLMRLFRVANYTDNIGVPEEVLQTGKVSCELIYRFSFERPFDRTAFINLPYYLGNLTQNDRDEWTSYPNFVVPNFVIERLFWQYYAVALQELARLEYDTNSIQRAVVACARGDVGKLFDLVQTVLEGLSNRDYQRFDEKYVKAVIMAYLHHAPFYYIRTEREIGGNRGYMDLEVLRHPDRQSNPQQYVMEIKYLKQNQADLPEQTLLQAKTQLQTYLEADEELRRAGSLAPLAVVVVKDKVYWEALD